MTGAPCSTFHVYRPSRMSDLSLDFHCLFFIKRTVPPPVLDEKQRRKKYPYDSVSNNDITIKTTTLDRTPRAPGGGASPAAGSACREGEPREREHPHRGGGDTTLRNARPFCTLASRCPCLVSVTRDGVALRRAALDQGSLCAEEWRVIRLPSPPLRPFRVLWRRAGVLGFELHHLGEDGIGHRSPSVLGSTREEERRNPGHLNRHLNMAPVRSR